MSRADRRRRRAREDHHRGRRGPRARRQVALVGALEAALLAGEIDLAVHSAKDVPSELAPGTAIVATPRRADPLDVARRGGLLDGVREGARVGTSALRRRAQLLALRPDLEIVDLRGNVDTRLRKLEAGEVDVLVLAAAGLERLGRDAASCGSTASSSPPPGQGVIAVQARAGSAAGMWRPPTIAATHAALDAERAVVRELGASCHTPVGVLSRRCARAGFVGMPDGSEWLVDEAAVRRDALAGAMLAAGAARAAAGASVTVYLVGAGPGDPGLLTVRARELIAAADVVLYDRLIPPGALDGARGRRAGLRRQAGRRAADAAGGDRPAARRARAARARRVVRLKGGDPFVFGRGGEEALVLREAGIPFEVVPGITAGDRGARLRRHPGHAPRARLAASRSSPATRTPPSRTRARLAGAGRASRARSSSTWACARCRGSPSG